MMKATNKEGQPWHPVVQRLLNMLEADKELDAIVRAAIQKTGRFSEPSFESYCELVHRMETMVPNPRNWLPNNLDFYYVLTCAEGNQLNKSKKFMEWVNDYVKSIGQWMNSPESVGNLDTF